MTRPHQVLITVSSDLTTKQIVTIKESEFNTEKYSKDLADCAQPGEITVCDLTTKKIVNIKEDEFNSETYTKDLTLCAVTPVTPPTSIPNTGAGSVLGIAAVVSALGTIGYRLWMVKRLQ
ncbi:MAG: hypothetical protein R3B12_04580 [Candidatus Saccharimonadales bacterium]